MSGLRIELLILLILSTFAFTASSTGIHLPIYRRGGRFIQHELANITRLNTIIDAAEQRYTATYTDLDNNRIVRRWRKTSVHGDHHMLDSAGLDGTWYTRLELGEPLQSLEFDLDMLSPDLYTIMTTSDQGSRYDTFKSTTNEQTAVALHTICHESSDIFHLPSQRSDINSIRLLLPLCQPPKSSRHTLSASGSFIGLSPLSSDSLSRLATSNFIRQLWDKHAIERNLFSIAILDSSSGILSIGDTVAAEIETIKIHQEMEFKYLDQPDSPLKQKDIDGALSFALPPGSTYKDHFKWTDVGNGAVGGLHTTLITGLWVNGIKVLKNQPAILDLNCPVILAPPQATRILYESMSGSKRLVNWVEEEFTNAANRFWAFPCLNTVNLEFELAGWRYGIMTGGSRIDDISGPAGGRFSLGKVEPFVNSANATTLGTGYCLGLIVEATADSKWRTSNMEGVWVLGEPFFRGLGIAFDLGDDRERGGGIGVRIY